MCCVGVGVGVFVCVRGPLFISWKVSSFHSQLISSSLYTTHIKSSIHQTADENLVNADHDGGSAAFMTKHVQHLGRHMEFKQLKGSSVRFFSR